MRFFLLILIFSSISGLGGFYYGRISASNAPAVAASSSSTHATATSAAPVDQASAINLPTEAPVAAKPSASDTMALRAAKKIQTLTDKQGRAIQAEILAVTLTDVTIRRADGLETTFALSRLTDEDAAFCEYLRANPSLLQTPAVEAEPETMEEIDWDAIFGDS